MSNLPTAAELADITRRFESFEPAATVAVGAADELTPEMRLVEAQAARQFYALQAEEVMRDAVESARNSGLSWHRIGVALGVTGEAMRQRYAH